jgi:hypothetical protein
MHKNLMIAALGLGLSFLIVMVAMLAQINSNDFDLGSLIKPRKRNVYGYVTGSVFLLDSIGLLISTSYLIYVLSRDYGNSL